MSLFLKSDICVKLDVPLKAMVCKSASISAFFRKKGKNAYVNHATFCRHVDTRHSSIVLHFRTLYTRWAHGAHTLAPTCRFKRVVLTKSAAAARTLLATSMPCSSPALYRQDEKCSPALCVEVYSGRWRLLRRRWHAPRSRSCPPPSVHAAALNSVLERH